jgi:hypothetical protein
MPFDLSLPLVAATGLALAAIVTWIGWPHIRVRTYNKTHGDLRVIEVALMLSRSPIRSFLPAAQSNHGKASEQAPGAEFVIYMTLKTGNL